MWAHPVRRSERTGHVGAGGEYVGERQQRKWQRAPAHPPTHEERRAYFPLAHLAALDDREHDLLADVIEQLTARYDALFDVSLPYSAGLHQAPTTAPRTRSATCTALLSSLLRLATVR